jgi:hypothetical protein
MMIAAGATILAQFSLPLHWTPPCERLQHAQIDAPSVATFMTLLLVPVRYSTTVLAPRIVFWARRKRQHPSGLVLQAKEGTL